MALGSLIPSCRFAEVERPGAISTRAHIIVPQPGKITKAGILLREVIKVFLASEQVREEIYFGSCDHPKIGPEQQSRKIQTGNWD